MTEKLGKAKLIIEKLFDICVSNLSNEAKEKLSDDLIDSISLVICRSMNLGLLVFLYF